MVLPEKDNESSTKGVLQTGPQWDLPEDSRFKTMGRGLFAVTLPVYGTSGSRLGDLAVDFSMLKLLETVQPSSQWSLYTHSLLLQLGPIGGREKEGPIVIGKSRPSATGPNWSTAAVPLGVDTQLGEDIDALLQGLP